MQEFGGDRSGEIHFLAGDGMHKAESLRMKGKAVDRAGMRTIFAVADDWVADVVSVDTNLIFTTSVEFKFHESVAMTRLQLFVAGDGKFAVGLIIGGIHLELRSFGKITADNTFVLLDNAFHHSHIFAVEHHIFPIMLHFLLSADRLGNHHQAGCVAVEAMNDEDLGMRVVVADIFAHDAVGRAVLDFVGTHRQHSIALVDDKNILVLIDELHAGVVEHAERLAEIHREFVAGLNRKVELA